MIAASVVNMEDDILKFPYFSGSGSCLIVVPVLFYLLVLWPSHKSTNGLMFLRCFGFWK